MSWALRPLCLLLLSGCFLKLPPVLTPQDRTLTPPVEAPAPVSFSPLEQRVETLIGEAQDADRRDRLVALRELMMDMRGRDPAAQADVYRYVEAALAVEERSRAVSIGTGFIIGSPVQEDVVPIFASPPPDLVAPAPVAPSPVAPSPVAPSPVAPSPVAPSPIPPEATAPTVLPLLPTAPPPLDREQVIAITRAALAEGRNLDAIELLAPLTDGEAKLLREEAVDGWARAERERAGAMFLAAKSLAPGELRTTRITEARDALRAVNTRFPTNAYARQIAENLATIDAALASPP